LVTRAILNSSGTPPQPGQRRQLPRKEIAHLRQAALTLAASAISESSEGDCLFAPSVPSPGPEACEVPPEGLSLFFVPYSLVLSWSPGTRTSDCSSLTSKFDPVQSVDIPCLGSLMLPFGRSGDTASCTLSTQMRRLPTLLHAHRRKRFGISTTCPVRDPLAVVSGQLP